MASNYNSTRIGLNYLLAVSFTETSTSTPNNTSIISCTGTLTADGSYWSTSYDSSLTVYWHDNREGRDIAVVSTTFKGMSSYTDSKSANGSITVTHNTDGSLSGYAWVRYTKGETTSSQAPPSSDLYTAWTDLTKIDRYPMITNAPNFTDEENPTITYTTTSGFSDATYSACISLTGATDDISYREVSLASGSYTFELTNAERNVLRNATPNSNIMNVTFFLRTTTGGTNYYSTLIRQMTIVNGTPTFTHTEQETNSKVIQLLGSSSANSIIENVSQMQVTVVPTALKGSTIASVRVASGSSYIEYKRTSPYVFNVASNSLANRFSIMVNDSRGNSAGDFIFKTLIEYTPVKINSLSLERQNPTSSNIILNLEATYYQQTFGSTANVPTVKWKLEDGSYTTIPSTEYVIDNTNHTLTITNYELSNALVYTSKGAFTIEVSDLLTSNSDSRTVLKGIPTFDVGEHDFQVNGTLYVADENRENKREVSFPKLLWENANPSSSFVSQTITLNSDDYDMLEIIAKTWIQAGYERIFSVKIPKWSSGILSTVFISDTSTNGLFLGQRAIDYSNDTTYIVGNAYGVNAGYSATQQNNDTLVPLYIIGYKTGLF